MKNDQLISDVCKANAAVNCLLLECLKSDRPDPIRSYEFTKSALIALKHVYQELKPVVELLDEVA